MPLFKKTQSQVYRSAEFRNHDLRCNMLSAYQLVDLIQKTTSTTKTKPNTNLANQGSFFREKTPYIPHDALLHHITRDEKEQAQKIIQDNPEILFESGKDNYTPVQLARCLHNVDMLKMMKTYLPQIKDGENKFTSTLKEADEEDRNQEPYDFKRLIDSLNFYDDSDTKKEMALFREYFKSNEIKNPKSYNIKNLLQAYAIYAAAAKPSYDQLDDEQLRVVLCEVIGHLQASLPIHYLKVISQKAGQQAFYNKPDKSVILSCTTHKVWIKEEELRTAPSSQIVEKDWHKLESYYQATMNELNKLTQPCEQKKPGTKLRFDPKI